MEYCNINYNFPQIVSTPSLVWDYFNYLISSISWDFRSGSEWDFSIHILVAFNLCTCNKSSTEIFQTFCHTCPIVLTKVFYYRRMETTLLRSSASPHPSKTTPSFSSTFPSSGKAQLTSLISFPPKKPSSY